MSLDAPRFGRVITAMVTPFDEGGALDLDSAANLAAWLVDNGSDGLVLAGTTGESPVLSDSEEVALTRAMHRCYLVAGTYRTDLDLGDMPTGVYYARLQNGTDQQVRNLLKVRG